jgi:hypothetical protein
MKRAIIITISLLLCVNWFFMISVWHSDGHYSRLIINNDSVLIWICGWIPILGVGFLLIRKKKNKDSN